MQFNETLVHQYRPFLKSMSRKVYSLDSADSFIDKDDIYNLLLEYMWEATGKYDAERGASFKSYLNMYINSRVKNIRRSTARRNIRGTSFLEDFSTEEKNTLESGVYSSGMMGELNHDFDVLTAEFSSIDKQIIDSILIQNIELKDYAKLHKISYSKAYRQFKDLKAKITKIIT